MRDRANSELKVTWNSFKISRKTRSRSTEGHFQGQYDGMTLESTEHYHVQAKMLLSLAEEIKQDRGKNEFKVIKNSRSTRSRLTEGQRVWRQYDVQCACHARTGKASSRIGWHSYERRWTRTGWRWWCEQNASPRNQKSVSLKTLNSRILELSAYRSV